MDDRHLKLLSKQMSWILRHAADKVELTMDAEGYVPLVDLLTLLRSSHPSVVTEDVHLVVKTIEPQKQRFTIDGTWIRANYGHSFGEQVKHEITEPPSILYHGTSKNYLDEIMAKGLLPMKRQYVHLTTNISLAKKVGSRHGKPLVLQVDTDKALQAGICFYRANPVFWLVSHLPSGYFTLIE